MDKERSEYQKRYKQNYKQQAKRVYLTLSNEEHRAFSRAAKGEKLAGFVKDLALHQLNGEQRIPLELKDELQELNRLVRNIANNLNQMSHSANIFRDVDQNQVFSHLIKLDQTVNDFINGNKK